MYKFLGGLQRCIEEGINALYSHSKGRTSFEDFEVKVWKQTWGDTSCGFGGIAGQAVTDAYTVVVIDKYFQECVVFHNMRYAYKTEITDVIAEGIARQQLMGAWDFKNKKYGKYHVKH
mgnify:CR=1 FL=1